MKDAMVLNIFSNLLGIYDCASYTANLWLLWGFIKLIIIMLTGIYFKLTSSLNLLTISPFLPIMLPTS